MSAPVLATKLLVPALRPRLVSRAGLVEQLDATFEEGHRLTLVCAPAGFGKTTVVSGWLTRSSKVHVGWLSLDDGDNDLARFLAHLAAALSRAGLEIGTPVVDALAGESTSAALTALVNVLASQLEQEDTGQQWAMVMDDYHVITAAEVHEAMEFLLEHLPDRLHLVVATRSDPPWRLARMRSRGQLAEIRAADLRFTVEESRRFLNEVMGLGLTDQEVQDLEGRTEGWVAGLQLAALSLKHITTRDERTRFIADLSGSNRFVLDYLADEVLARQADEVREFLLQTAVLERLTGPLCDAVTGRPDGAGQLARLERENLFVVPLDSPRRWYRYHHLFGDVLRSRLAAEHPDQLAVLHLRASAWYADHGFHAEAVRHALEAGDHEHAGYLMERGVPELRRTRQDALLQTWMRSLPEQVVQRSPVLSLVACWSFLMAGDLDAAASRLDDAEAALAAGAADPARASAWAETEDLRTAPAMAAVYRASLAQARGDVDGIVRHARRALDLAGPGDHFVRGAGGGFLGLAAWAAGEITDAVAIFSDAVRSLHAAGNLVDELDSTIVLGDLWLAAGRPSRARQLYVDALRNATAGGEPYPRAAADLHVGLAELDWESDDLASAEEHLEVGQRLAERSSITENRYRWYVAAAQVRRVRGDYEAALHLLDEAEARYRPGFYPNVRPVPAVRARVQLAAGDLGRVATWVEDSQLSTGDRPEYLREYEHLTLVRFLLAQYRAAPATARHAATSLDSVVALLDRLRGGAERAGRSASLVEITLLQALTHDTVGRRTDAVHALRASLLDTPEPGAQVRLFLDEGAPMLALLQFAATTAARDGDTDLVAAAHRLLARPAGTSTAAGRPTLAEPLSERELQVLQLLASELTGPAIARQLYVSLNTFRTHTRRIFTKLDVSTRAAAVRRAREKGLL